MLDSLRNPERYIDIAGSIKEIILSCIILSYTLETAANTVVGLSMKGSSFLSKDDAFPFLASLGTLY